jgi:hypothetical protein
MAYLKLAMISVRVILRRAQLASAVAALLLLSGCGSDVSRTFGLTRDAPDEFQVTTRAPLSMPPDFALRPPQPGAGRPQEQSQRQQAEATLAPQVELAPATTRGMSPGESALVAGAGPAAPPDIRQKLASEAELDQPTRTLTDRIMFWKPPPPPGVALDPEKEAQRLRQNAALGRPETAGDTPIIQRKSPSFFEGLF